MRRALVIATVLAFALTARGQAPDSCEAKYPQIRQRQLAIVDALYRAVLDYYPLQLLDTVAWRDSCVVLRGRIEQSTYEDYLDLPLSIRELLYPLTDDWNSVAHYEGLFPCESWEIASDMRIIFGDPISIDTSSFKYPRLAWTPDGSEIKYVEGLKTCLDRVRAADGLLLNPEASWNRMTVAEAVTSAGRFVESRTEFLRARVRVPQSNSYRDTVFYVEPTGDWQYTRPIVILVDSNSNWPARVFLEALTHGRRYVQTVGGQVPAPPAIMPRNVELPGNTVVSIPTAYAMTINGKPLGTRRPDMRKANPERALQDLIRRFKRERVDRLEDMFRK